MRTLCTIGDWLKRHSMWLLLVVLGAWTGAALIRKRSSQVNTLESALAVQRSKQALQVLRKQQAKLVTSDRVVANEVLQVSAEITRHKRAIAEAHAGKGWDELSDDEVRAALREAGL